MAQKNVHVQHLAHGRGHADHVQLRTAAGQRAQNTANSPRHKIKQAGFSLNNNKKNPQTFCTYKLINSVYELHMKV